MAVGTPVEQKITVGAQHAGLGYGWELRLGDHLAGAQVHGPDRAMGRDAALFLTARGQADIVLGLVERGLDVGAGPAALGAPYISDHALLIERGRKEGGRAVVPGARLLSGLAAHAADSGIELHAAARIIVDRLAGLGIDALGPVHLLLILIGPQELSAGAIEGVEETVAREVRHHLAGF